MTMKIGRVQQNGFTLIEVLIAIVLLSVGILAAASMQISALGGNHLATRTTTASSLAAAAIEELMLINARKPPGQIPYDDLPWLEATVDPDDWADALDDPDLDARTTLLNELLNDDDPATAFRPDPQPADFEIFWNVVADYPLLDSKTIRITVRREDRGVTMIFTRRTDHVQDFVIMKPF